MSEGWVQTCEELLERIRKFSVKEDKDRLDLVQSMMFSLYALHRSLLGWINWVNNPDVMATFKKEELDEMNKRITEFTESFIEYDLEATKIGVEKSLKVRKKVERREGAEAFYI